MDSDLIWRSLGGGAVLTALITAVLTLVRLWLERDQRRRSQQSDLDARLERILQDRLAEADRRFERCDEQLHAALRGSDTPRRRDTPSHASNTSSRGSDPPRPRRP